MRYASLSEFLAELQDCGELIRVAASVDSALELSAIVEQVRMNSPDGGPAILFENVRNATIPVVTNLLGNRRRLCRCLGISDLEELPSILDQRMQLTRPNGWLSSFTSGGNGLNKWGPKSIKTGTCQQVVRLGRDVDLWGLPIPRCWPDESFPTITAGLMVTRHPQTEKTHYFQSPLLVTGQQELAWYDETNDRDLIIQSAINRQQNLPVAISLGGDALMMLAVAVQGIEDLPSFAGLLADSSLEVVRCRTNELDVPAASEIVIEGYIDCANPISSDEITVARSNGRYVQRRLPLIKVTAVTHRANPVFPARIVSTPPDESASIALAAERMLLPLVRRKIPEIVDIRQPVSSANRNLLFVSIRKSVDFEGRRILHALWGTESLGQMKTIVVVDADQDLRDEQEVWFRVGAYASAERDYLFSEGLARDDDYTSAAFGVATRIGIDATRKLSRENSEPWPKALTPSREIAERIRSRWAEFGIDVKLGLVKVHTTDVQ